MFGCVVGNGVILATFYSRIYGVEHLSNSVYAKLKIMLAASDILLGLSVYPVIIYYAVTEHLFSAPSQASLLQHAKDSTKLYWVYISGSLLIFTQSLRHMEPI